MLKYDALISNFAYNLKLRRYTMALVSRDALEDKAAAKVTEKAISAGTHA
jgi:hypothetical protein